MIDQTIIDDILDRAAIEEIAKTLGLELKSKGSSRRLWCHCPFHAERTPSFMVDPACNKFYCFSCGKGGNAITLVMNVKGFSFVEAVKWLAHIYNIEINENKTISPEQILKSKKREAILNANKIAADFFHSQINAETPEANKAKEYVQKRWGQKLPDKEKIGYAPGRKAFLKHAKLNGLSLDLLKEIGLLTEREDKKELFDGFYNRVVIPIRSQSNQIIGFTARNLDSKEPKYVNSKNDDIVFKKGDNLFGIHNATREAATEGCMYFVEGAPDVLKLQSLDICNVVAPLGTACTKAQLETIRKYCNSICFIPDIDKPAPGRRFGPGIEAVFKNGIKAIEAGLNVTVKEIVPPEEGEKADADSYFNSKAMFEAVQKEDYITWYVDKIVTGDETSDERAAILKKVSEMLANVRDKSLRDMLTAKVRKTIKISASIIQNAINNAVKRNVETKGASGKKMLDQELYQKYGFSERDNCYYSLNKDGQTNEWSNFVMEPLFHIKDQITPKRLFRIKNKSGVSEIIELKQEDLVSLARFKLRVEGFGNFIWKAKEDELTKLKGFLYEKTETAIEITQLGWQREGFFAFGNGLIYNNDWIPTDEYGIARIEGRNNYYLPGSSVIFKNDRKLFQFERRLVRTTLSNISLREYSDKLIEVFGDNAKVGLCFMMATLFKDVVTSMTKNFPILNLFGPKGSGKSELGHSLMAFFIIDNDPPNLSTASDAALADTVAQCANVLVHIDEYKNTIELTRREFIKGLYDGVGRTRMNMERDKKRETTAVDCGVILSGQEMPTIDIAIFQRMIFLTTTRSEYTTAEKQRYAELKQMRDLGCSHLIPDLLCHRKRVESEFRGNYQAALADLIAGLEQEGVEDRILRNWTTVLAIYRTLSGVIDVPFDYKNLLLVCHDGILRQNKECKGANEQANFWQIVDFLHQNGDIFIGADYRIKYETTFRGKGMKEQIIFKRAKPILYLCLKRVVQLYKKQGKTVGETTMSNETLRYYLEISKEYLGIKNAVRFQNLSNTMEAESGVDQNGFHTIKRTSRTDWALCFDYEMLRDNYHINLEVETNVDESAPDPIDIDENDDTLPY